MAKVLFRTLQVAAVLVALAGTSLVAAAPRGQQKMPDPTLKDRIEFGIETSSIVKRYSIDVKVTGMDVILTGTVATAAQKAEAERLAKIAGATKIGNSIVVDKNVDLTVSERLKKGLTKTGDTITDAWITTKVKWFFWGDDQLRGSDINVDTADRVVTLKGTVKTPAGQLRAVALATDTEGVKKVVDQLKIVR